MKYAELTRKLRRLDCHFTRHGAGSHEIRRNPAAGRQRSIPYHRTKDIGPRLPSEILRQLGIDREEFDRA